MLNANGASEFGGSVALVTGAAGVGIGQATAATVELVLATRPGGCRASECRGIACVRACHLRRPAGPTP
jgi:hypothetical protein